jgi:hypothetical protein
MRREAITLVFTMFAGTVLMAACEKKPPEPKTAEFSPPTGSVPAVPPGPVSPSASERKDGQPPVQGQVDANQAPQRKDFQTTR